MNYHLGILHLAHLLVSADGHISDEELAVLRQIQREEDMKEELVAAFVRKAEVTKEADLYSDGIAYLNECSEGEKLCAFVHLYRLAEADSSIHVREVRFLLYGVKSTNVDFDDVMAAAKINVPEDISVPRCSDRMRKPLPGS